MCVCIYICIFVYIYSRLSSCMHTYIHTYIHAYIQEVDMILVGAAGVCESGAIVNKIGTYQVCICVCMYIHKHIVNMCVYVCIM